MSTTWKVEQRRRRALEVAHLERKRRAREGLFGCLGSLTWTVVEALKGNGLEYGGEVLLPSEFFPEDDVDLSPVQIGYARSAAQRVGLWDGSDTLSKDDLLNYLRLLGHCPDDMRLGSAMEDMQMLSRDSFTFGEALHIWHHFLDHRDDEMRMLKRAFQFFDRDSSGTVSQAEMMETNNELEDPLTAQEIQMFFQILDTGGDGVLQYQEFFGIINSDYEELNENVQLPVNSMRIVSNNLLGNDSDDSDEDEPTDSVHQPRTLRWQPPTRLRTNDSSKECLTAQLSLMSVRSSDGTDLAGFEPIEPITPRSTGAASRDVNRKGPGGGRKSGNGQAKSVGFTGVSERDVTVPGSVDEGPRLLHDRPR